MNRPWGETAVDLVVKHSRVLMVINLLLLALLAAGAGRLTVESGVKTFFAKDDPNLLAQEALESRYGRPDNVLFVLDAGDEDLFTSNRLALLEELTEQAWQMPHSRRVVSLSNYQHPYVTGDDIMIEALIEGASGLSVEQIASIRETALSEPLLVGRLISPSGQVAAVNVMLNLPETGKSQAVAEAVIFARKLASSLQQTEPSVTIHLAGWAVTEQTLAEVTAKDGMTLMPILFMLVLVLLVYLLRSLTASLITLLCIAMAVAAGMGFAGWIGISINNVNVSAPTIIMTLAVADCVHLFSAFLTSLRRSGDKAGALRSALHATAYPIFLTSVTTAIGFFSMNLSDSPPFKELGTIATVGVLGALWLVLTVVPGLVMTLPFKAGVSAPRLHLAWLAPLLVRHCNGIFYSTCVVIAFFVLAVTRLELNDDPNGYFSDNVPLAQAIEVVETRLSGTQRLHWELDAGSDGGILEPAFMGQVEQFTEWLRSQPEVVNVTAFPDILKRLNQVMNEDDPSWRKLPESRAMAAQYALLYELSVPYGLDTTNRVSADKSALRLSATLRDQTSSKLIAFERRSRDWLRNNAPDLLTRGAGTSISFAHIGLRNINSMLFGSLLALLLISGCLAFAFRSLRYGLVCLAPNLFPAITALGIWTLLRGEVNIAASVVFSLTLGIIVDDTTHFMVKYIDKRRQLGSTAADAVSYAIEQVGTALVTTSVVLVAGFLVLVNSDFMVNATSGLLVSIVITLAIVLDLTFLPCLLLKADNWLQRRSQRPDTDERKLEDRHSKHDSA